MSWEENCYDVWNPSACTLAWVPGRQKRSTTRDIIVLTRSTDRKTPTLSTASKIDYQKALQEDHTGTQGPQQLAITNTTIQQHYHNTNTTEQQTTTTTTTSATKWSLEQLCFGGWILLGIMTNIFKIPVSRRSTNAPFCLWSLNHNIVLLLLLKHLVLQNQAEQQSSSSTSTTVTFPVIMERMNRHSLILFLIANLLTGLVNLTIPTLDISDGWALLIIFGYITAVGIVSLILEDVVSPLLRSSSKGSRDKESKTTKAE